MVKEPSTTIGTCQKRQNVLKPIYDMELTMLSNDACSAPSSAAKNKYYIDETMPVLPEDDKAKVPRRSCTPPRSPAYHATLIAFHPGHGIGKQSLALVICRSQPLGLPEWGHICRYEGRKKATLFPCHERSRWKEEAVESCSGLPGQPVNRLKLNHHTLRFGKITPKLYCEKVPSR